MKPTPHATATVSVAPAPGPHITPGQNKFGAFVVAFVFAALVAAGINRLLKGRVS